ncbi:MAG: O-antigen ligase family protein [Ardenticatenaceae bacterium]|nr:O-antigen ligase family protein [Ardenticatenaceae bacterium]MCB8987240.1 O-antigen ligase family protein [Ardenticatenaceae bacterium]
MVIAVFLLFPATIPSLTAVSLLLLLLFFFIRPLKPTPFNVLWLGWWSMVLIAVIVSADPDLTLPKLTGLLLGYAWWLYLSTAVRSRPQLWAGFLVWGILGAGFLLIGILSAAWIYKVPLLASILQRLPGQLLQLPGSAAGVQPNQLAGTLLLYLPLLLSLLLGWRPAARPRLALTAVLLLTLLTAVTLLLTQSRSGWLGAAGGLLVLLILWAAALPASPRRRWFWRAAAALLLLGLAAIVWIGPERLQTAWDDPSQLSQTAVGSLGSIGFRQEVWRWALTAVGDFPFTGTGLGTFRQVVRRLYPLNVSPTYDIAHAHDIFLQTALDVGLPGLIVYLALLLIAFWLGWQAARRDATLRPFALGLLAGLAALHIYGLTDALALGSKTGLSFWLALGLLTAMHRLVWQAAVIPPVPPTIPAPDPDRPGSDPAAG